MVQTFYYLTPLQMRRLKFMQRDIITITITWHLGLVGYNNFGEYTSFSPFTLHEFLMSYSHTEWYLPFIARRNSLQLWPKLRLSKSNQTKLNHWFG